jgi:RNA polymerase sigma factor (sigma-70 family)
MSISAEQHSRPSAAIFATTQWSEVVALRDGGSAEAFTALEGLCRSYWRPVYAYIRRDGFGREDAQDLTQEFFRRFIEKQWIDRLEHRNGKFRSFLLTFLKHFLSDERDRAGAKKRGGGRNFISLDELKTGESDAFEPRDALTADQVYERRWAQTVMERAVARLRQEYVTAGQGALYDQLRELQPGERRERRYAEIGERLGMSESAIKSAMHRLRLRHRNILRNEIGHTVSTREEVDAEIRHLIQVLS